MKDSEKEKFKEIQINHSAYISNMEIGRLNTKKEEYDAHLNAINNSITREVKKQTVIKNKLKKEKIDVYNLISQLPFVNRIKTVKGIIAVETIPLKVRRGSTYTNFGPYIFVFDPKYGRSILALRKLGAVKTYSRDDDKYYGNHHMYAEEDGRMCYGRNSLTEQVARWCREGRLDLVLILTWDVLSNFNEQSIPFIKMEIFVKKIKAQRKRRLAAAAMKKLEAEEKLAAAKKAKAKKKKKAKERKKNVRKK